MNIWPEGEQFTQEVIIPTGEAIPGEGVESVGYEKYPAMLTFMVPAFDVVVEMYSSMHLENIRFFSSIHRWMYSNGRA